MMCSIYPAALQRDLNLYGESEPQSSLDAVINRFANPDTQR